jgi:hypothetical protein
VGSLVLGCLPAFAGAQPVGSEFQVNTYTEGYQRTGTLGGKHLVASDASGNFVVVWTSLYQDGSGDGVFGQRFDSSGGALGSEFRVNTYTSASQETPSVAGGSNGDFVVVWQDFTQDGSSYGIFGQRFDGGGVPQGAEFRVNSYTTSVQKFPSVASDASANFVVVWNGAGLGDDYGIFGQRFDGAGAPQGAEFRVNSYTTSSQDVPAVASDAGGNFVVVWHGRQGPGDTYDGIFAQRFDSAGVPQGAEFRVNTYTRGAQRLPSVASNTSGNFVVVWQSRGQDGPNFGIFGQRYDSGGGALGDEFQVNTYTTADQSNPSVASDASGNFVVAWVSPGQDGDSYGVFGQRYDSLGVAQGDEFQIASYTTGFQNAASVGATGDNRFVVAWESEHDGSRLGVFGQRFAFAEDTITVVSPNTNVRWRIGSVQKIKWTHGLGGDATFRIELDRDDDGTYEELIASEVRVDSDTKGFFAWTVTGPVSGSARVRVSWTADPAVSDSSDETFQIRPGEAVAR